MVWQIHACVGIKLRWKTSSSLEHFLHVDGYFKVATASSVIRTAEVVVMCAVRASERSFSMGLLQQQFYQLDKRAI